MSHDISMNKNRIRTQTYNRIGSHWNYPVRFFCKKINTSAKNGCILKVAGVFISNFKLQR